MQQVGSRRLLPMVIIVLFLAAAAILVLIMIFRANIAVSPLSQEAPQPDVSSAAATTQTTEDQPDQPEDTGSEDCMQATMTVVDGRVTLRRSGEDDFFPVTRSVWVGCGDIIRTGADGTAQIVFFDGTETTVFSNSQLVISAFTRNQDGTFLIHMQQYIGHLFYRVNFPSGGSFEVETPNGVAAVRGTAFYVDVIYDALAGMTPEEIENFINTQAFFDEVFGSDPELLASLGAVGASFDVASGQVVMTYTDESNQTQRVILNPGEVVEIEVLGYSADGSPIVGSVTIGTTSRHCGDGICDEYMGETNASCPADC